MTKPIMLSIIGEIGSGKTHMADMLMASNHFFPKHRFFRKTFAVPLKEAYSKFASIPRWHLDDREHKEKYRQDMCTYSADKRKDDPVVWTRRTVYEAAHLCDTVRKRTPVIITDDMRFDHELAYVSKLFDVITVSIRNVDMENEQDTSHMSEAGLKSEKDWRNFPVALEIQNDPTEDNYGLGWYEGNFLLDLGDIIGEPSNDAW